MDWHEREAYDLIGIQFEGHHDLRRILLPDDWRATRCAGLRVLRRADRFHPQPGMGAPSPGEAARDAGLQPMSVLPPLGPPGRDAASRAARPRPGAARRSPPSWTPSDLVQLDDQTMELNMGPQHPSTHGVLRLVLNLAARWCGLPARHRLSPHRLREGFRAAQLPSSASPTRTGWTTSRPSATMLGFSLAAERLLGVEVPPRGQYLRVIMCELARIASHLIWYGTTALDLGATTPFVYAWREREKILDITSW